MFESLNLITRATTDVSRSVKITNPKEARINREAESIKSICGGTSFYKKINLDIQKELWESIISIPRKII